MNTYLIYKMNCHTIHLLKQYPAIEKRLLHIKPSNPFFSHQIETLFDNNDGINEYLYSLLGNRSDYKRVSNLHTITNQLTKEKITCKVNDYNMEIIANQKSNIFFDILYQKSKSYVIITKQCKNQEV